MTGSEGRVGLRLRVGNLNGGEQDNPSSTGLLLFFLEIKYPIRIEVMIPFFLFVLIKISGISSKDQLATLIS